MGYWSDDIVMYAPGLNPHSGIYHGKGEVHRNLVDRNYKETSKAEVLGLVDHAIGSVMFLPLSMNALQTLIGRVFDTKRVVIYRWANHKIIEIRYFDPDQKPSCV